MSLDKKYLKHLEAESRNLSLNREICNACYVDGASKYLELLLGARIILNGECCCPDERSWTTGEKILCDPCEMIAKINAALGDV